MKKTLRIILIIGLFSIATTASAVTVLFPTQGGTGTGTYAQGDILYSDATNSLAKLGKGTAYQVLHSASNLPAWTSTIGATGTRLSAYLDTADINTATINTSLVLSGPVSSSIDLDGYRLILDPDGGMYMQATANDNLGIMGGNVGIGTTGPTSRLTLEGITGIDFAPGSDTDVDLITLPGVTGAPNFMWDESGSSFVANVRIRSHVTGTAVNPNFGVSTLEGMGMFKATTSQLAFSTNNAEQVRIDSSGNVGIGTTGPGAKLHITDGTTAQINLEKTGTGAGTAYIYNDSNLSIESPGLLYLRAKSDGSAAFSAKASAYHFNIGSTEKVRIDSDGNVGIGTTAPGYDLDVVDNARVVDKLYVGSDSYLSYIDSTSPYIRINAQNDLLIMYDGGNSQTFAVYEDGTHSISLVGSNTQSSLITSGTSNDLLIDASGGDITIGSGDNIDLNGDMYIENSSGNVGIGTTGPDIKLYVASNSSGAGVVSVQNTNSAGYSTINLINSTGTGVGNYGYGNPTATSVPHRGIVYFGGLGSVPVGLFTAGSERLRVDNSGNVGIGTTGPQDALHIHGSTNAVIRLSDADGTGYVWNDGTYTAIGGGSAGDSIFILDSGNVGIKKSTPDAALEVVGDLMISAAEGGDGDRFIVDTNGNVGIGTTAPVSKLDVDGGIRADMVTADPCGGADFPEATIFYNDTSNYYCYCDGTNDVKLHDPAVACF